MAQRKSKSGLDVVEHKGGNDDEVGEGIVGTHGQTDKLRDEDQQLVYGGGHFEEEKAGLEDGVSLRETINPDDAEPNYDYDVDPMTGNAPERKEGRNNNETVKGKGKSFEMGEF